MKVRYGKNKAKRIKKIRKNIETAQAKGYSWPFHLFVEIVRGQY